jgi:hypothetical protein
MSDLPSPSSSVAGRRAAASEPPSAVSRARLLILGSLVLGVLTVFGGVAPPDTPAAAVPPGANLVVFGTMAGITLWLVTMFHRGHNWARWAMFAFLATTWGLAALTFAEDFTRAPMAGALTSIGVAMELVACWYLFSGESARWYAALGADPAKGPAG